MPTDLEIVVLFLRERLLGHDERPQPLPGHVVHLLLEPVVVLHDRGHDGVGALHVEHDLARLLVLEDDAHPLRLGGEGERLEDGEAEDVFVWGGAAQFHRAQVAVNKSQANLKMKK